MEKLIDYLIYALCGHNYVVKSCVRDRLKSRMWMTTFEGEVRIILDEDDLTVLKEIYNTRDLDDEERRRYEKLFSDCDWSL